MAVAGCLFGIGTLQLKWVHADPQSPQREAARLATEDQRAFDACGYGGSSLMISADRLDCQHAVVLRAARVLASEDPLALSIFATTAIRHAEFSAMHQAAEEGDQRKTTIAFAQCSIGLAERALLRLREVPSHGLSHWVLTPARIVLSVVNPIETLGGRGAERQVAYIDALDRRLRNVRLVLHRSASAPTPVPPSCIS
jgi:hypothetical protein